MSLYPNWAFADALSYIKYAFVGVSLNEDSNLSLYCTNGQLTSSVNSVGTTIYNCVISPTNKPPYTVCYYLLYIDNYNNNI